MAESVAAAVPVSPAAAIAAAAAAAVAVAVAIAVAIAVKKQNLEPYRNSSFSFQGAVILGDLAPGSGPVGIQLANLHVGRLLVRGFRVQV